MINEYDSNLWEPKKRKFNNVYRADNFTPNFDYTFQRVHFILEG